MSDYLWDKTGEPEEDVERLENLLGALRYQPRPLEIPATAMPTPTATTGTRPATMRTRPATLFSRPRLALAASLVLTMLAGAWVLSHRGDARKNQLVEVKQGSTTGGVEGTETATPSKVGADENASAVKVELPEPGGDEAVLAATTRVPRAYRERARRSAAGRQRFQPRLKLNSPAPHEEVAANGGARWQVEQPLTPQQREATEQLMLALRLASAKLNYAQREMLEIGRAEK
jgi:hypothetical protein